MPSAQHANTANSASLHATFPSILVTACLLSLLRNPAGSTDAFPCLFYFSQPLTALHNCQIWLVSALVLTGSHINFYTVWKRFHIPSGKCWNIQELVQDTFDALDSRVSRARQVIANPIKTE